MPDPRQTILIAGPTASGKSALALALARELGGAVVNADSMQVYRELAVLTARPTEADQAAAPHRLYGHVAAREGYSAGRWAEEAAEAIANARAAGLLPIVVGGTGLYFKALTDGLSPMPPIPPAVRERWRQEGARCPPEELHALLAARDSLTASRLAPTDPQRIVRALEVLEATGRPLAAWQEGTRRPVLLPGSYRGLVLAPERGALAARIEARFEGMLAGGALAEVERLSALGLDSGLPALRALGVRPLMEHLAGRLTLGEATARAKAETRRYSKRQRTWFRHQLGPEFAVLSASDPAEALARLG